MARNSWILEQPNGLLKLVSGQGECVCMDLKACSAPHQVFDNDMAVKAEQRVGNESCQIRRMISMGKVSWIQDPTLGGSSLEDCDDEMPGSAMCIRNFVFHGH